MDAEVATLASYRSDDTLVPHHGRNSPESRQFDGLIRFEFTFDNPCNTTIFDPSGAAVYSSRTVFEPRTATVVDKAVRREDGPSVDSETLFTLEWHDILSDKISIRGGTSVFFTSVLSPSHVLSRSRKFYFNGETYRWSNLSDPEGPRLYVDGNPAPVAVYRHARRPFPPSIQARLLNPPRPRRARLFIAPEALSNPGLLDMIFITFLPMEKSRRIMNTVWRHSMYEYKYAPSS